MSKKHGAKGYNPVAVAIAEEKRQESNRMRFFNPFNLQQKAPWAARKKQGSPGGRA